MKRTAQEHQSFRPFHGFTLVELLVTIAIIGILIGLLIPTLQGARESARRLQCLNNAKQLALAVSEYEDAFKTLPVSSRFKWDLNRLEDRNQWRFGENWVIQVLPFLEQQALYDAFNLDYSISDTRNAVARGTPLPVMTCPSDANNRRPFNGSASSTTTNMRDGWARGNYGANASMGLMNYRTCMAYQGISHCAGVPGSRSWNDPRIQGVMGVNWSLPYARIRDGASNTIMLAELRAGVTEFDPRGVWAMSGPASALWGHSSLFGDVIGPNSVASVDADNIPSCADVCRHFGCSVLAPCPPLARLRMGCYPYWHNQSVVSSEHLHGVVAAMCDGSVHFISDWIDAKDLNFTTKPSVWTRLNAAADKFPIDAEAF